MTFALVPMPGHDGKSHFKLKYLKSQVLPPENWHWVHMRDDKLALENQMGGFVTPSPGIQVPVSKTH